MTEQQRAEVDTLRTDMNGGWMADLPVKDAVKGSILCERHAKQAARAHKVPTGICSPMWQRGMVCDVVANPARLQRYLNHVGVTP